MRRMRQPGIVFLTLVTLAVTASVAFPGILVYLILWLVVPKEPAYAS